MLPSFGVNTLHGALYYWKLSAWSPLANKYVYLYRRNAETRGWVLLARLKTDASGRWDYASAEHSARNPRVTLYTQYYAKFFGDGEHWGTTSKTVGRTPSP